MYPMKIIQKNMRSVGKIEFDKPRLITDGLTELNWITRLVLDENGSLVRRRLADHRRFANQQPA